MVEYYFHKIKRTALKTDDVESTNNSKPVCSDNVFGKPVIQDKVLAIAVTTSIFVMSSFMLYGLLKLKVKIHCEGILRHDQCILINKTQKHISYLDQFIFQFKHKKDNSLYCYKYRILDLLG